MPASLVLSHPSTPPRPLSLLKPSPTLQPLSSSETTSPVIKYPPTRSAFAISLLTFSGTNVISTLAASLLVSDGGYWEAKLWLAVGKRLSTLAV